MALPLSDTRTVAFRGVLLFVILLPAAGHTQPHRVAITIDDLPIAQSGPSVCDPATLRSITRTLLHPLQRGKIPVTAFVIGYQCPQLTFEERRAVLQMWRDAGIELGNHTWSHADLNTTPLPEYEASILREDAELMRLTGLDHIRYFRWPMLHAGKDAHTRQALSEFLQQHGYQAAPVTFDNSDWMFAYVYSRALDAGNQALARRARDAYLPYMESVVSFFEQRALTVTNHDLSQILLMHANRLNSELLPALLDMFRRRGYRFITLAEALQDAAYQLPDTYAGPGGFSWIHRWSITKGMPPRGEPDEPEFIRVAYEAAGR